MLPHRRRARLLIACLALLTGLWLLGDTLLQTATAPGTAPHAMVRLALPGMDLGIDAEPAQVAAPGYVELWVYPHHANDYRPVLRVYGAPALVAPPVPSEERPAPTPTVGWRAL